MNSESTSLESSESKPLAPTWVYFWIGVGLLIVTAILDISRPFDRSWSILYVLVALYGSWSLRGRAELGLLCMVLVATFVVPLVFRIEMIWPGAGLFYRTTGMIAGLVPVVLIWDRRRYIAALHSANHGLERIVAARTSELRATNDSLRWEIDQRKKLDESLRISENRFALFMEHLPGLAWIKDTGGRYVYANDAALKAFQKTRSNVYGKTDDELFPRETAIQFKNNDRRTLETGKAIQVVELLEHEDGIVHHSVVSKFSLPGPDGSAILVGGLATDITERQQAEETIRKIGAFRETIIRTAAEGICVCHVISDLPFVEFSVWNQRMTEITGYTIEEINRLGWYQSLFPDAEVQARAIERMSRMRQSDDLRAEEWEIMRKDGERRTIAISTSSVETDEGVTGVVALIQDVTERRRVEVALQMMRFSVDHAGESVFWISREGRILYVNDAGCETRGYSRDELLNMTVFDLDVEPDYQPGPWEQHFEDLKKRGSITLESRHRSKDGRIFPIEVNANYAHIGDQEFNFAFVRDITERKRIEEELVDSRRRLEVLSRQLISTQETERRHLARELHDEIGQMLTAIKLSLRKTQRQADATAQSILEDNVSIVDQAIGQVRNLALSLRPAQLDELGLVAALHWLVKHQADLGGFTSQLDVELGDFQIPADLQTVCFRISQEALTNAIRHGMATHVKVKLRAIDDKLFLSVQDNGKGFDVDEIRRCGSGGKSFGLISMRERAGLVGGNLEIHSVPGNGTQIEAWMPLPGR